MGAAPGEPGRIRALLDINIGDLAGMLEFVAERLNDQDDIYRLTEELKVDSDHILRLTEAAELLGFATVAKGDIRLTPLGETFAEASILVRNEIFATRIRRLPLVRWLIGMLQRAAKHALDWEVVKMALELEFPPEEAEKQLDTLIAWSRYAELFAYDDSAEEIYLETDELPSR